MKIWKNIRIKEKKIELFGKNNLSTPKPYFKYERRIGPHNFFFNLVITRNDLRLVITRKDLVILQEKIFIK